MRVIQKLNKSIAKFPLNQRGVAYDALIVVIVAVLLVSGVGYYISTRDKNSRVLAQYRFQYCVNDSGGLACMNAWNGGPWVKVYTHKGVANNYFLVDQAYNGNLFIQFAGGGSWNGRCVGDAYNNSGYASASLDQCPSKTSSFSGGWGTNFKVINCKNNTGFEFYNYHWRGYLSFGFYQNGSQFYLNSPEPFCFTVYQ